MVLPRNNGTFFTWRLLILENCSARSMISVITGVSGPSIVSRKSLSWAFSCQWYSACSAPACGAFPVAKPSRFAEFQMFDLRAANWELRRHQYQGDGLKTAAIPVQFKTAQSDTGRAAISKISFQRSLRVVQATVKNIHPPTQVAALWLQKANRKGRLRSMADTGWNHHDNRQYSGCQRASKESPLLRIFCNVCHQTPPVWNPPINKGSLSAEFINVSFQPSLLAGVNFLRLFCGIVIVVSMIEE